MQTVRTWQLRLAGQDPQALPACTLCAPAAGPAWPARTVCSRTLLLWLAASVLRAGAAVCPIIASDFWQEMEMCDANRNCCWVTAYNTEVMLQQGAVWQPGGTGGFHVQPRWQQIAECSPHLSVNIGRPRTRGINYNRKTLQSVWTIVFH